MEVAGYLAHTALLIRHASLVATVADFPYRTQAFIVNMESNAVWVPLRGKLTADRQNHPGACQLFWREDDRKVNLHRKLFEKFQNGWNT